MFLSFFNISQSLNQNMLLTLDICYYIDTIIINYSLFYSLYVGCTN